MTGFGKRLGGHAGRLLLSRVADSDVLIAVAGAAAAQTAAAPVRLAQTSCVAPTAPPDQSLRPRAPTGPVVPACINVAAGTHRCKPKDLQAYNTAIDRYNVEVTNFNTAARQYMNNLRAYIDAVDEYQTCETGVLNAEVDRMNAQTH